jgi:hypothetical protein
MEADEVLQKSFDDFRENFAASLCARDREIGMLKASVASLQRALSRTDHATLTQKLATAVEALREISSFDVTPTAAAIAAIADNALAKIEGTK